MCPQDGERHMARDRSGYVFRDKHGKWYARTTITDSTGRRRNVKRQAHDKREAKALLRSILAGLEQQGTDALDFSKLTFNELADFYATHYCKAAEYCDDKKIAGLRDMQRARGFLMRFREHFGRLRLRDITYRDIQQYRNKRLKMVTHYNQPPTIATMNRELGVLRRMFNIALREAWIQRNPFNAGEPLISPSSERRREQILSLAQEQMLLSACEARNNNALHAFLVCLLDTGARKSELEKHLRWRSVCFESRVLTIEGMTTKTLETRQVAMTERMCHSLRTLFESSTGQPDDRVFRTLRNLRKGFASVCRDAGVTYGSPTGITLHSLRHTAATRLVQGGMSLQLVGRILGHSQVSTTYRYVSAGRETLSQAASILESLQSTTESNSRIASGLLN